MKNRMLTTLACICLVLLTVTLSIALPIYIRPFYTMQIDNLDLPEKTGLGREEIREAYHEVMDYLTLPGKEFGTGILPYSQSGKAHFEDCKVLFNLNTIVFLCSVSILLALLFLKKKQYFRPCKPFGRHYCFLCGISTLSLFGLVGALAALNFQRAFEIFHRIFFPGKDNWIFNAREDAIILILPQEFFLRCGLLIVGSILLLSVAMILYGNKTRNKTPVRT